MTDPADPSTAPAERAERLRPLRSVRVRITLAAAVVTAVAMAAAGWLLVRSLEASQMGAIRQDTEDLLDLVAARLEAGVSVRELVRPGDLSAGFVQVENEDGDVLSYSASYVSADGVERRGVTMARLEAGAGGAVTAPFDEPVVRGGDGGGLGGSGIDKLPKPSDIRRTGPEEVEVALDGGAEPGAADASLGPPVLTAVPLEARTRAVDAPSGQARITVASPVDQAVRSLDTVQRALLLGLPLLVGLVTGAAWWLVGRALRPVEAIRAEAEAIGGSTLHRRVPDPATGDEIGRLAGTMNAMLERLEASSRRQRQFVSDASHELRTPVAAIRTDLEVALIEGERADWPATARAALAEEARLETVIADLLLLAADDEGAATMAGGPVDLAEVARDEAGRTRPVKVTVDAGAEPDIPMVVGSRNQLQRALGNLVDNAARHARSEVRVGVEAVGATVQLCIDDDGPGIPPADRDRVFERFTRLDDGRARDRGGAGLGLAVVRSIVTRHGGWVWADESPLGGARFVLVLPQPAAPPVPSPPSYESRSTIMAMP